MTDSALATIQPSAIARTSHETTTAHSAALAKAEVEARFAVAVHRPRDMDEARHRLLLDCKRPHFAAVARYSKPVGGKPIEGPSIRFAEAALRALGNVEVSSPVVYEDEEKRIVRVTVCDLESNLTHRTDITIAKTVERRKLGNGQKPISTRTNTYGETVYIVAATDDELAVKQAALVSKALRTLALRIVPGDLVDEAMDVVIDTQRKGDTADPEAARKKLVDAFAAIGVSPMSLKEYLSHEISACSPAELTHLRAIYAAIKDGETSWKDVTAKGEDAPKSTAKVTAVHEHLKAKKSGKADAHGDGDPSPEPEREPGMEG
jgi:hypothetical protein